MHDHEHPEWTRKHQYRYLFTSKHHDGKKGAAQWLETISEQDEFAIFDGADEMDLADEEEILFGAAIEGDDSLRCLGTYQEQIAEYPHAPEGSPWHGYPVWAINHEGPANRRNQKHRPPAEVFEKIMRAGLITEAMRARLMKGKHV